jgi:hypothetical protein
LGPNVAKKTKSEQWVKPQDEVVQEFGDLYFVELLSGHLHTLYQRKSR